MSVVATDSCFLPACPLTVAHPITPTPGELFDPEALAVIRYGEMRGTGGIEDSRFIRVCLQAPPPRPRYETWTTRGPITTGASEGIRYAHDRANLFGWIALDEGHLTDLEETTRRAYTAILRLLHKLDFPHWLRVWNYLSDLNDGNGDRERYRRFTVGRHQALARTAGFERLLPAATAIGMRRDSGLRICFLASRVPGVQVENPRQVSAFRYPSIYGLKSPAFSRAVLQHWSDRSLLYVSGTGSIVGHATQHLGDAPAQFDETLRNVDALLDHAARQHFPGPGAHVFKGLSLKLFARSAEVLKAMGARRVDELRSRGPTMVLIGDLCRRDLLVEVEGVFEWSDTT